MYLFLARFVDVALQHDVTVDVAWRTVGQRRVVIGALDEPSRRRAVT